MEETNYGENRSIMLVVNSYDRKEFSKVLVEILDAQPRHGSLKKEVQIAVAKQFARKVNFVLDIGLAEKILNLPEINKKISAEVDRVLNEALSADGRKVVEVSYIRFDFISQTGMAAIVVWLDHINMDAILDGILQKYKQKKLERQQKKGKLKLTLSQKLFFDSLEKLNESVSNAKKVKMLEKLYKLACDWDIPNKLLIEYASGDSVGASYLRRINPDLGLKIMG